MQFSFRKPHFWHPQNLAKTLFWHNVTLFVFSKIPQNTAVKNLDQFLTLNLDQFLTLKPPNLGPVFNFTACIYIYMLLCLKMGCSFPRCIRECPRLCVRKWGTLRPRAESPYFYSVSWVFGAQQLLQELREICGVVLGQHADNEACCTTSFGVQLWLRTLASGESEVCSCQ